MLRTTSTAIALAAALGLGLSGTAIAGDNAARTGDKAAYSNEEAKSGKTFAHFAMENPKDIQGQDVHSSKTGEKLGEIQKLVQSREDDQVYVVLEAEDYLAPDDDAAVLLENFRWGEEDVILMSQDPDLPLSAITYDEVGFKDFEYTAPDKEDELD